MCEGRFRPTRAREICLLIAALWVLLPQALLCAGLPLPNVRCGQQVQGRFSQASQVHEHRIEAEPGQTLDIQVVPIGEYLKIWVIVVEPSGAKIADSKYQKKVQLQTGQLSAKGLYLIKVYNSELGPRIEDDDLRERWRKYETLTGDYVLSITCINSDGTWVVQGAKNGDPSSPTGSPEPATAAPSGALGKYGKELQEVQATIGAVASTAQALRELWGAFRPKRQGAGGEPGSTGATQPPAYESPQDMVPKGQQPVYARPVEALEAQPQSAGPASVVPPSGGRTCQENFEESGEWPTGKSFKSHVEVTGTRLDKVFLAIGRSIGMEGFLGVTTNRDLGLISAYQESRGEKSIVTIVISDVGTGAFRAEAVFRPGRGLRTTEAAVRGFLCRALEAAAPIGPRVVQ